MSTVMVLTLTSHLLAVDLVRLIMGMNKEKTSCHLNCVLLFIKFFAKLYENDVPLTLNTVKCPNIFHLVNNILLFY